MQHRELKRLTNLVNPKRFEGGITVGEVIDTNDPQQMGRLRIMCAAYGDSPSVSVGNLPWAIYASPFGGMVNSGTRGRGNDQVNGPIAYGMWNIPKVGSHVLVGCIDGDPSQRFWFASIFPQYLTHTLPHGRFMYNDQETGKPEGPLDSTEQPINPLYENLSTAFTNTTTGVDPRKTYEFRTRGADAQGAALGKEFIGITDEPVVTKVADDRFVEFTSPDGKQFESDQGYAKSRIEPDVQFPNTDGINWDPQTYSYVTPGGHAISMDDRANNCRVRIRTTGGMQVILDDTNERIYVGTCEGNTYFEMDEKGTIDVYSSSTFSVRAGGDINFTTDQTFRVFASQGIHMASGGEIRLDAKGGDMSLHTSEVLHIHANSNLNLQSGGDTNVLSGGALNLDSSGQMNLLAGGMILQQGSQIHFNGPSPTPAAQAGDKAAYYTSRIPDHEGWARVYNSKTAGDNDTSNSFSPEYGYNDPAVGTGSAERGISFNRNPLWRR